MNERFVCVKVDREERPDVDALYMDAVQAMTGHGGWPLNVFLTPEQAPFYGGTYFPPEARMGMPSWRQVLGAVAEAWDTQREEIRAQGERVAPRLAGGALLTPSEQPLEARLARRRGRGAAPGLRQRQRRLGRAAQVPAGLGHRVPAGARRAADGAADAALDGRRRHLRPGRRRLLALQRRRALDGPALREDALRQRAARARLPARLPGQRRRAAAAHRRGDARLGPARDARARGRLLQRARRRLRGRRGQVLRLEHRRAARRAGRRRRRGDRVVRRHRARQLRGRQHPRVARARAARRAARADPRDAARRPRRSACARASTTSAWPPGTRS